MLADFRMWKFEVRERAQKTNLRMWKGRIWQMRGSQGAIGTPAGARKDKQQKKSFLRTNLGFLFLILEFYAQMNHQR